MPLTLQLQGMAEFWATQSIPTTHPTASRASQLTLQGHGQTITLDFTLKQDITRQLQMPNRIRENVQMAKESKPGQFLKCSLDFLHHLQFKK